MSKFGNENMARMMPSTKPTAVASVSNVAPRRRVLGDITNAHPEDEQRDSSKKPVHSFSVDSSSEVDTRMQLDGPLDSRPYMQRPADDIDASSRDLENPQMAASYANEIYANFFELERRFRVYSNYMGNQEFINEKMRCILVDWLVEVHLKFKMALETLFITVQLIDRYLEKRQVRRSRLQLVGVSALLVASKYEEIFPPEIQELVYITDKAYTKKDILEMESDIIETLDYQFCVPTTHTFLCRFLKAAHADRTMVQLCCYLVERSLQEYSLVKFLPSQIAAAAVLIARVSMHRHKWSPTLLKYTTWDEPDLAECVDEFQKILSTPNNQQNAVYRKYSAQKFGGVARMNLSFK